MQLNFVLCNLVYRYSKRTFVRLFPSRKSKVSSIPLQAKKDLTKAKALLTGGDQQDLRIFREIIVNHCAKTAMIFDSPTLTPVPTDVTRWKEFNCRYDTDKYYFIENCCVHMFHKNINLCFETHLFPLRKIFHQMCRDLYQHCSMSPEETTRTVLSLLETKLVEKKSELFSSEISDWTHETFVHLSVSCGNSELFTWNFSWEIKKKKFC